MTKPISQIALELTPEQRRAILASIKVWLYTSTFMTLPVYRDGGKMTASLVELGLARWSRRGAILTAKGEKVWVFLQAKEGCKSQ